VKADLGRWAECGNCGRCWEWEGTGKTPPAGCGVMGQRALGVTLLIGFGYLWASGDGLFFLIIAMGGSSLLFATFRVQGD
jgi:hypothetical protein